jgi:Phosphoserine phosphatase RsbU, N-terminal domain
VNTLLRRLGKKYMAALRQYLKNPGEPMLQCGYELGRNAVESGLGVLETAALYQKSLAKVLSGAQRAEESRWRNSHARSSSVGR